jgi:hypothetical protein
VFSSFFVSTNNRFYLGGNEKHGRLSVTKMIMRVIQLTLGELSAVLVTLPDNPLFGGQFEDVMERP